jgi:hypothetical protein
VLHLFRVQGASGRRVRLKRLTRVWETSQPQFHPQTACGRGGTGRRAALKMPFPQGVSVRFRPPAPSTRYQGETVGAPSLKCSDFFLRHEIRTSQDRRCLASIPRSLCSSLIWLRPRRRRHYTLRWKNWRLGTPIEILRELGCH